MCHVPCRSRRATSSITSRRRAPIWRACQQPYRSLASAGTSRREYPFTPAIPTSLHVNTSQCLQLRCLRRILPAVMLHVKVQPLSHCAAPNLRHMCPLLAATLTHTPVVQGGLEADVPLPN